MKDRRLYAREWRLIQGSYGSWKTWKVLEFNLHFPGLESPGKFWKSVTQVKKIRNLWQTERRINIEILGVKGLM